MTKVYRGVYKLVGYLPKTPEFFWENSWAELERCFGGLLGNDLKWEVYDALKRLL
jgi:hypothetical protein